MSPLSLLFFGLGLLLGAVAWPSQTSTYNYSIIVNNTYGQPILEFYWTVSDPNNMSGAIACQITRGWCSAGWNGPQTNWSFGPRMSGMDFVFGYVDPDLSTLHLYDGWNPVDKRYKRAPMQDNIQDFAVINMGIAQGWMYFEWTRPYNTGDSSMDFVWDLQPGNYSPLSLGYNGYCDIHPEYNQTAAKEHTVLYNYEVELGTGNYNFISSILAAKREDGTSTESPRSPRTRAVRAGANVTIPAYFKRSYDNVLSLTQRGIDLVDYNFYYTFDNVAEMMYMAVECTSMGSCNMGMGGYSYSGKMAGSDLWIAFGARSNNKVMVADFYCPGSHVVSVDPTYQELNLTAFGVDGKFQWYEFNRPFAGADPFPYDLTYNASMNQVLMFSADWCEPVYVRQGAIMAEHHSWWYSNYTVPALPTYSASSSAQSSSSMLPSMAATSRASYQSAAPVDAECVLSI